MEKKEEQLNSLLEDALDDLLEAKEEEPQVNLPNIKESLKKITEVTGGTGGNNALLDKKSADSRGESSGSGLPDGLSVDEEEMNKFFENMTAQLKAELPKIDPKEARAKINESVPQIFDLMQNLLSKELLYPALKDLSPKFDEWLKKNSASLNKDDHKRYTEQKDIINEIIDGFDDESLDAQGRFERNMDLMEKMQSLGSPPEELTVPEGVGKCSIM